eukprot:946695-Pyramimonas_sp.AAC.1
MSCAKRAGPPCARQSSEMRGCPRRDARPPRAGHRRAQSCEDVSSETGWTKSRAASPRSELRGCLRRNAPGHPAHGISELRVRR